MSIVAITQHSDYNVGGIRLKLEDILSAAEILNLVREKDILIKPNCTGAYSPSEGRTTNSNFLRALAEILKDCGANIVIGESSSVGVDTMEAYCAAGISDVAHHMDLPLIDFKKSSFVEVPIDEGLVLEKIYLPSELLEADYIISLAKMKTNYVSQISCSMKNMKGTIPDYQKRQFHRIGLSQSVVDLNSYFANVIGVVDGIVGSELYKPRRGEVIVASLDRVACDAVCARIMGLNPYEVDHIRLAEKQGLGYIIPDEIIGAEIGSVSQPFRSSPPDMQALEEEYNIKIVDGNACSACIGSLYLALKKTKETNPGLLDGLEIIMGPTAKGYIGNNSILFGNCSGKGNGISVPGCVPTSSDFISALTR